MTTHASGTFDVKLSRQAAQDEAEAAFLTRMSIDKRFHGDLDAVSRGLMLAARRLRKGRPVMSPSNTSPGRCLAAVVHSCCNTAAP